MAGTNSSSLTDQACIDYASGALLDIRKAFIKGGVDVGNIQETYFTPTAGVGQYNYPQGPTPPACMLIKTLWVNFNDTTQNNYVPVGKYDAGNLPEGTSLDYLRVNQPTADPIYDDHGSWFEILPTPQSTFPNLTNAIKMIYFVLPTAYATTGDTVQYPENQDPDILAYGIQARHLRSQFKFTEADAMEKQMYSRITNAVAMMGGGGQSTVSPTPIGLTGYEF